MRRTAAILLFLVAQRSAGQNNADKYIRAGNEYYRQNQYGKAVEEYNKALEADPGGITARFNRANAFFKLDQQVEAARIYSELSKDTRDKSLLAKSQYNKGVVLSRQKNLEESIEAYKNALRSDPSDPEARENLQKALLELKKKKPPPKQQEKKSNKKKQQPEQSPPQGMSRKESEQRLKLLQQKEKEVQQRMQKEKNKSGGGRGKDW